MSLHEELAQSLSKLDQHELEQTNEFIQYLMFKRTGGATQYQVIANTETKGAKDPQAHQIQHRLDRIPELKRTFFTQSLQNALPMNILKSLEEIPDEYSSCWLGEYIALRVYDKHSSIVETMLTFFKV